MKPRGVREVGQFEGIYLEAVGDKYIKQLPGPPRYYI